MTRDRSLLTTVFVTDGVAACEVVAAGEAAAGPAPMVAPAATANPAIISMRVTLFIDSPHRVRDIADVMIIGKSRHLSGRKRKHD
jgi:hypothetical protein